MHAEPLLNEILSEVTKFSDDVTDRCRVYLEKDALKLGTANEALAVFMIARSLGWCRAAQLLVREGHCEEAATVVRSAFERIVVAHQWASTYCFSDTSVIPDVQPQKHVAEIKALILEAGRFYGNMSEIAHYSAPLFLQSISLGHGNKVELNLTYHPETRPAEVLSTALLIYAQLEFSCSIADWIVCRAKGKTEHWISQSQPANQTQDCIHLETIRRWNAYIQQIESTNQ